MNKGGIILIAILLTRVLWNGIKIIVKLIEAARELARFEAKELQKRELSK